MVARAYATVRRLLESEQALALRREVNRAFTAHPHETDETYLQHLWFTWMMSLRFAWAVLVILLHGLFPFLLARTSSRQIESVYRIMKSRIPKSRREAIDADYSV